jgi:hypothetical protein
MEVHVVHVQSRQHRGWWVMRERHQRRRCDGRGWDSRDGRAVVMERFLG